MAITYPLDPVIRLVDNNPPAGSGQKLVTIDAARRTVVPAPRWFGSYRRYLVGNADDARYVGTGSVSGLQLRDIEHNVAVSAKYDVRCPSGNEDRVALALFDPSEAPAIVLQRHMGRWLSELSRGGIRAFIDTVFANRKSIEAELAACAARDVGLDMNILLSLDAECTLNRIDVQDEIAVTVSDFDDETQQLEYKVGVEVNPDRKALAILQCARYDDIHRVVPETIERFIRDNVTMHAFGKQTSTAAVRQPLIRALNEALAEFGRKAGTLTLIPHVPPHEEYLQESIDVMTPLQHYSRPVKITNKVQMHLVNLGCYAAAKAPPLKKWLKETLERVVPELLFESSYVDVILRLAPLEAKIKSVLAARAAGIGYELQQFITVHELAPNRWRDPFRVEVDGEFPTRRSDVAVKLRLVAVVYIPRLDDIENKLDLDQPVPVLMQQAIQEKVIQYLHGIGPERYYTEFDQAKQPGAPSVEKEIDAEIRKELQENFHCAIVSVAVKPLETDLMAHLKTLRQQISELEIEVPNLNAPQHPLVFRGKFRVDGVDDTMPNSDGWHRFQSRRVPLNEIRKHIEDHLRSKLHARQVDEIAFRTPKQQEVLTAYLCKAAQDYTRDQFGLVISLDSIIRDSTGDERNYFQIEADATDARLKIQKSDIDLKVRVHEVMNDHREAQITKLLEAVTDHTAVEGTADEIEHLEKMIADKAVGDDGIPSMEAVRAMALPERSDAAGALPAPASLPEEPGGGVE